MALTVRTSLALTARTSLALTARTSLGLTARTSLALTARTSLALTARTSLALTARTSLALTARTSLGLTVLPRISYKSRIDVSVCNRSPLVLKLIRANPAHTLPSYFLKIHFNIILRSTSRTKVVIATVYGLDDRGSNSGRSKRFFSTPQRPDRPWGPSSLLFNGSRGALSPGLKSPGREADHSPLSSVGDKNGDGIPPLLHTSSWDDA
jgi:hypothetical protein